MESVILFREVVGWKLARKLLSAMFLLFLASKPKFWSITKMVVSDRVVRALEFFPILLALSTLSAPIMLMSSSAHLTIRGVNACFYSAAPPIKFP
jgi:hypothetical protein